jgi:DNA-binding NarL/FixJ family response regulator
LRNRALPGLFSGLALIFGDCDFRACPVAPSLSMRDDSHVSTTVLIVDDHAAFRSAARKLLEGEDFEVVGEAADGASGVDLARQLQPDLVLLDVVLPDLSGFDVAEKLSAGPSKVVLVSSRGRSDFGPRLLRSPALGFVSKDQLSGERIRALLEPAA